MRPRILEWRSRLLAWADTVDGKPFVWGETDCGSLARAALAECFGVDVAPSLPQWSTAKQAAAVLKKRTVIDILTALGAEQRPIAFARTGDIIIMTEADEVGGVALGVWLDAAVLLSSRTGVHTVAHPILPLDAVACSLWEVSDG